MNEPKDTPGLVEDDETVCDHCFRKESDCVCSDYDIDADFGDK